MAKIQLVISEEYINGRTTMKEVERLEFKTIKAAFEYCENVRKKEWGEWKGKLNWWEIKDKRVWLPMVQVPFRRLACIEKIETV